MTNSLPNQHFIDTADRSAKKVDKDRKRKATDEEQDNDEGVNTPEPITQLQLTKPTGDTTIQLRMMT